MMRLRLKTIAEHERKTLAELAAMSDAELLRIPKFGKGLLRHLRLLGAPVQNSGAQSLKRGA